VAELLRKVTLAELFGTGLPPPTVLHGLKLIVCDEDAGGQ
jgi:hypothetical protein